VTYSLALFSDDRAFLVEARPMIETYLATLRLKIHPIKSQLFETCHGATFVGFRVFPDHIRVKAVNLHRGRYRLRQLKKQYAAGHISAAEVRRSLQSWAAHLSHADTWQLRRKIFTPLSFSNA